MNTTQDPRPPYLLALGQLEKLIAEVTPETLGRPTPCTEYDLRQLLGHVVGGMHRLAYIGEGGRAEDVVAATGDLADDAWPAAFDRARARVTAAWADDAKLDRPSFAPWGEVPGRAAVGGYVMEVVTHSWDIARTLGSGLALDEQLAEGALAAATAILPAGNRGGPVPFGPVRPAPADADATTRLAAWLGREV
ncbi:TIGR03086 family metal-binding protein [Streptomyces sp. CB01881]|uniref:TIGR03086 family metal-binding protein n=1 Tax=Streptomyces sp. CB01881 TaxID=2078691 RepID=UPI000CDC9ECA|nr:TIGR03086 family metal-binding protein [Streptomyces sp. CB01881]AUY51891.1 TIGR03086 family protein [Streptomyces sp. CB01881]TYC71319.1 TIGR03086 family protein [Streptomyces sp. CB01881]